MPILFDILWLLYVFCEYKYTQKIYMEVLYDNLQMFLVSCYHSQPYSQGVNHVSVPEGERIW